MKARRSRVAIPEQVRNGRGHAFHGPGRRGQALRGPMARQIGCQQRDRRKLIGVPKTGECFLRTAEAVEEQDQILISIPGQSGQ